MAVYDFHCITTISVGSWCGALETPFIVIVVAAPFSSVHDISVTVVTSLITMTVQERRTCSPVLNPEPFSAGADALK